MQHTPSALECLAHFAGRGGDWPGAALSIAHTGGFWVLLGEESRGRVGRGTEAAVPVAVGVESVVESESEPEPDPEPGVGSGAMMVFGVWT